MHKNQTKSNNIRKKGHHRNKNSFDSIDKLLYMYCTSLKLKITLAHLNMNLVHCMINSRGIFFFSSYKTQIKMILHDLGSEKKTGFQF